MVCGTYFFAFSLAKSVSADEFHVFQRFFAFKMLKMSYKIHLSPKCFLFMKHNIYLCSKLRMYGTKHLPSCLNWRGTKLYWKFTRSGILQDLLQHQACCRWRTQQGTFQKVGKLGNMGISYIVQQNCLSFICFLGQRKRNIGNCHSRNHQENPKDTKQGNCESRSY